MNDTLKPPYDIVKNPIIRKLLPALENMPQDLIERRRKIFEKKAFRERVWRAALLQAG